MGGDAVSRESRQSSRSFNPRPRMGGDHCRGRLQARTGVSIHAPVWGATFNRRRFVVIVNVSIHAPVWGATLCTHTHTFSYLVSIHAPVWGATDYVVYESGDDWFQSTPPYGGRRQFLYQCDERPCFNPRPRMGGDGTKSMPSWRVRSFNPRPRMGGDS